MIELNYKLSLIKYSRSIFVVLFLSTFIDSPAQTAQYWKKEKKINTQKHQQIYPKGQKWIKLNHLRMLADEVQVFYEFPINDTNSIEIKSGLIYSNPVAQYFAGGYFFSPYFYPSGFFIGGGYRMYLENSKYIQFNAHYKYKGYDTKSFWTGGMSGTNYENYIYLNQFFNITGLQVNFGKIIKTKSSIIKDKFFGFGLNFMHVKTNYIRSYPCHFYGCGVPDDDKLEWDNGFYLIPTIHIGSKLCRQMN